MAFLLPRVKTPKPPELPAAPRMSDSAVADAAAEQRRRLYLDAPGRRSTLGGGLDGPGAYRTSVVSLLGLA